MIVSLQDHLSVCRSEFEICTTFFITIVQAHFAQTRSSGSMSPLMPGFHSTSPRLAHQQVYFGQVGPGLIPQTPGYGFQQQHMPALQPGVPSNFVLPFQLQQQTQPGPRPDPRRGANSPQPQQQVSSSITCLFNDGSFVYLY